VTNEIIMHFDRKGGQVFSAQGADHPDVYWEAFITIQGDVTNVSFARKYLTKAGWNEQPVTLPAWLIVKVGKVIENQG
jgi:hypothetical protein